jgi:alanine-synthesizing transaminase
MFSERTNWKLTPNKYTQALEEMRASGESFVDLTVSNPTGCGLQYHAAAILEAFQNPKALNYQPEARGLLAAREAVARYYREDHAEAVDPESVLLTTSTSEAYSYVFRLLCNAHDEILVPTPSYPLFDFLADLQDVTLRLYALQYAHGWFIDFESMARALTPRTRAVLLVHPNNPTGSYVKSDELLRLNALCREKDLALIVDEVFLDYVIEGSARKSFAGNSGALTFTLSGLSKIAALPQMKVAWMVTTGPELLVRPALQRLEVIADTYLSMSSPTQWAIPQLLEQRRVLQPQILSRVRENWKTLKSMVAGKKQQVEVLEAQGGWYAVLRVATGRTDEHLAIEIMRKARVLVHPGHFYDFAGEGHLVVSLIVRQEDFRSGMEAAIGILE